MPLIHIVVAQMLIALLPTEPHLERFHAYFLCFFHFICPLKLYWVELVLQYSSCTNASCSRVDYRQCRSVLLNLFTTVTFATYIMSTNVLFTFRAL